MSQQTRSDKIGRISYKLSCIIIAAVSINLAIDCVSAEASVTVYWENDGTFVKPNGRSDRHYTEGLKIAYTHQPKWRWLKDFGVWNNFGAEDGNVATAIGYFIGQNMYTPDYVDKPAERDEYDMVFAGWLYGGVFAQRATASEMEHFELNMGVIGPSAQAKEVQRIVHKIVDVGAPRGWSEQIGDEFAVDFSWWKRQQFDDVPFKRTSNFDTHLEYGFAAGSVHRNANMGMIFRLGEDLPNDFGPGRLEAPDCAIESAGDERTYLYLFSRATCRVVEYNRFLTGLNDEPVVGYFQFGVVWRYRDFEVSYSQTFMTRQYEEQPEADSFAALNLSYHF